MKKALRMGYNSYFSEEVFKKNLSLVSRNTDVVDEITLFTEPTHHGYWTLERCEETANVLRDRIKRYKGVGVKRVGVNVLCTIGHTEDGADIAPVSDMQYMVNFDGVISRSCVCPSDERFFPYIAKRYALLADTGADFIWIDDDLRIHGHGIMREYCFCPACQKKYNERNGTRYTEAEIKELFLNSKEFKASWHKSAYDTIAELCKVIKGSIKNTNDKIEIGYMNGPGADIPEWVLNSGATMARPGGGFYNDLTPITVFDKFFLIEELIMKYPDTIKEIQYEYEEYNFLTLQKSKHIAELETSLMILSGCDGMLYNRWEHTDDFLEMTRRSKKKWDILEESTRGCKSLGVYCASRLNSRALMEIGIPTTPHMDKAFAFYIVGDEWNRFSSEEIEKILKVGVYTDALGLQKLKALGIEDLGGETGRCYVNGVWEHFTEDELNGEPSDRERFVSLDIFKEADAYELIPSEKSRVVSVLNSAFGGYRGCSAYVCTRSDGSVITVDGCLMPKQLATANKKTQMTNIFDLTSNFKMPVVIEKSIKVAPVVTSDGERVNIMLTNAHFDPTGDFDVKIRLGNNFKLLSDTGELLPVNARKEKGETIITIDSLGAWKYVLLIGEI